MPKAIRYRHKGQYLKNTLFWTQADFLGAYHAQPEVFDAALAAIEEAQTIESHKQDFAVAFGLPAEEIECEVIAWDGNEAHLPFTSDENGTVTRLPVERAPVPPTLEEQVAELKAQLEAVSAYAGVPVEVIEGAKAERV